MSSILPEKMAATLLAQTIGAAIREPLHELAKGLSAMVHSFAKAPDFEEAHKHMKKVIGDAFAIPPHLLQEAPDHTEVPKVRKNREMPTYGGEDDWGIGESMA